MDNIIILKQRIWVIYKARMLFEGRGWRGKYADREATLLRTIHEMLDIFNWMKFTKNKKTLLEKVATYQRKGYIQVAHSCTRFPCYLGLEI